jgi:hypothetical protein
MHFCFNHPCDPDVGLRSQKIGSLKDFEVRGVIEKQPTFNERRSYQSDRHGHLPEVSKKFWRKGSIVLSVTVPNHTHISTQHLGGRYQGVKQAKSRLMLSIGADQRLSRA